MPMDYTINTIDHRPSTSAECQSSLVHLDVRVARLPWHLCVRMHVRVRVCVCCGVFACACAPAAYETGS